MLVLAFIAGGVAEVQALPGGVLALCVAPLVLYLAMTFREPDPKQFLGKSVAVVGFAPILLLMWGGTREPEPLAAVHEQKAGDLQPGLDEQRVFEGALAVQDVSLHAAGIELLRTGVFADGTELRLSRLTSAQAAGVHLRMLAQAQQGRPLALAGRSGMRMADLGGQRVIHVEQHGRDLLQVSGRDVAEVLARLHAQAVPMPHDLAPDETGPSVAQARSTRPFVLSYVLGHAIGFVLFILWSGTTATRVRPAPGALFVDGEVLRARLFSINDTGLPCVVLQGSTPEQVIVDFRYPDDVSRAHRATLWIDAATRKVSVRETGGAHGARPRDAEEASMRGVADARFDPTRPKAQRISVRTVSATIVTAADLASVPLSFRDGSVELGHSFHRSRAETPASTVQTFDEDQMIYLLCQLVIQSGYTWQPVFFRS